MKIINIKNILSEYSDPKFKNLGMVGTLANLQNLGAYGSPNDISGKYNNINDEVRAIQFFLYPISEEVKNEYINSVLKYADPLTQDNAENELNKDGELLSNEDFYNNIIQAQIDKYIKSNIPPKDYDFNFNRDASGNTISDDLVSKEQFVSFIDILKRYLTKQGINDIKFSDTFEKELIDVIDKIHLYANIENELNNKPDYEYTDDNGIRQINNSRTLSQLILDLDVNAKQRYGNIIKELKDKLKNIESDEEYINNLSQIKLNNELIPVEIKKIKRYRYEYSNADKTLSSTGKKRELDRISRNLDKAERKLSGYEKDLKNHILKNKEFEDKINEYKKQIADNDNIINFYQKQADFYCAKFNEYLKKFNEIKTIDYDKLIKNFIIELRKLDQYYKNNIRDVLFKMISNSSYNDLFNLINNLTNTNSNIKKIVKSDLIKLINSNKIDKIPAYIENSERIDKKDKSVILKKYPNIENNIKQSAERDNRFKEIYTKFIGYRAMTDKSRKLDFLKKYQKDYRNVPKRIEINGIFVLETINKTDLLMYKEFNKNKILNPQTKQYDKNLVQVLTLNPNEELNNWHELIKKQQRDILLITPTKGKLLGIPNQTDYLLYINYIGETLEKQVEKVNINKFQIEANLSVSQDGEVIWNREINKLGNAAIVSGLGNLTNNDGTNFNISIINNNRTILLRKEKIGSIIINLNKALKTEDPLMLPKEMLDVNNIQTKKNEDGPVAAEISSADNYYFDIKFTEVSKSYNG